jgi:hypothetical protein
MDDRFLPSSRHRRLAGGVGAVTDGFVNALHSAPAADDAMALRI